jgi:chromosome segregation ATPase
MDDSDVKQVLRALAKLLDHLGRLPDLTRELNDVAAKLAPVLKGQEEELARSQADIREVKERDVYKATEKLVELERKIADAQQRHASLEASERSLQGRLSDIRERVEKASEGFKLQPAAEA